MEQVRELVNQGKAHFTRREFQKAESYLRKAIQQNAAYADVYHMLGVIHHTEGRFAQAIDCFQKALKINPHYTEATLNLAVLYNDLGQYKEAKKLYTNLRKTPARHPAKGERARMIEPVLRGKLANLHAEVGDIYCGLGLYRAAVEEYQRALALNPSYADIRTKMGVALREDGSLAESLAELKQAARENGGFPSARVQLGVTYYALGKPAEAKKEWEAVLKSDPNNALAQMYVRLCDSRTPA